MCIIIHKNFKDSKNVKNTFAWDQKDTVEILGYITRKKCLENKNLILMGHKKAKGAREK